MKLSKAVLLLLATVGMSVCRAESNSVPSCYAANKLEAHAPVPQRAIFILIDETTVFNNSLRAAAWDAIRPVIKPGVFLSVIRFSAFSQQRYTTSTFSGVLEEPYPEKDRHSQSTKKLRLLDDCLKGQAHFVETKLGEAMAEGFSKATSDLAKSDVMAALKDMSVSLGGSPAKDKTVFVLSDMLENSSISSFYARNGVRKIDPSVEMDKVKKLGMTGDYGQAKVWVMGAGIVPEDAKAKKGIYRDPLTLKALNLFWSQYFKLSNAELVDFGTPELKVAIH